MMWLCRTLFSSGDTVQLFESAGTTLLQRLFDNYAAQRNLGIVAFFLNLSFWNSKKNTIRVAVGIRDSEQLLTIISFEYSNCD